MTLYNRTGYCPLELWLTFHEKRKCNSCPMYIEVHIGVGWLTNCGHECILPFSEEKENDDLFSVD